MAARLSEARTRTLLGILSREERGGYADQTISEGIDSLLKSWAEVPRPNPSYWSMSPAQRRHWAEEIAHWLGGEEGPVAPRPRQARAPALPDPVVLKTPLTLDSPITAMPRMRRDIAARLQKLSVETIRDALYFFPRRHIDFSHTLPIAELQPGAEVTLVGFVWKAVEKSLGRRLKATEAVIGDETGNIRAVWFNQPYLAKQFKEGTRLALSGKVTVFQGHRQLESPEYEFLGMEQPLPDGRGSAFQEQTHTGRLIPVYPLTEGLSGRTVRQFVRSIVDIWADKVADPLPEELRARRRCPPLAQAIRQAHYPDSLRHFVQARRRLAFEELLALQLWMLQRRMEWQGAPGQRIPISEGLVRSFKESLPFQLTGAQERALADVLREVDSEIPMLRLLQGDVGSGKTVVAAAALLSAAAAGHQGAIMAPTEILAEQHYRSLTGLLGGQEIGGRPLRVGLLVGKLSSRDKRRMQRDAAEGEMDIVVGTHALIQERVEFRDLALTVIDEQHRFGTAQRQALRQKGVNPHVLVMTATPVPRTLALTVYGDLELSIIDEMPPGRQAIQTKVVEPFQRAAAERFVRAQVQEGRQAYVVCPLIDESEQVQARAATAEHERLSTEVFPDLQLGLLHGRMSGAEKDDVMGRFRRRELDILVSTTVIEVGIDVPNATIMMIEGANRFGLSQLHQLRGRVGRGEHRSYCLLLLESFEELGATVAKGVDALSEELPVSGVSELKRGDVLVVGAERMRVTAVKENRLVVDRGFRDTTAVPHRIGEPIARFPERLAIMERLSDGFRLAEEDFRLRGPGTLAGTRQSGLSDLRMAQLPRDCKLLEEARAEARVLLGHASPTIPELIGRLRPAEGADVS